MVECLRRELMYSEKRARDRLFTAIEGTLAEPREAPLMVSQLTREAVARARADAERSGFAFENWDNAGKAVVKAMTMAGVLLTPDRTPVPSDITAPASLVAAVDADYVDRTEACLLEFLVRRLGDVTVRDHVALAHALFRQFDPNVPREALEDRVVVLFARLAGRIELRGASYVPAQPTHA
jgi:hypothetical protein